MGAYQTKATTQQQYKQIINTIRKGFTHNGIIHRANYKVSFALVMEANLALRISDITNLKLCDIIKTDSCYQLNIIEQKTHKERNFIVPSELYNYIENYCFDHNISCNARIVNISERAVQQLLKECIEYLGYQKISTHSFRKMAATNVYENSGHDVALTQQFLQHSSSKTTMLYINRSTEQMDNAINKSLMLV